MAINAGTAIAYLTLDTSKFSKGFKDANSEMNNFKNSASTTQDKVQSVGKTMSSVGGSMTKGLTLPLGGVGAAAIKVSKDFESGMAQVKSISGVTGEEFDKLRNKALEMGKKTKFSASESAEAMNYMAMAGWDAGEMVAGIEPILNLAAAGNVNLATTSDIVTDALTGFGLTAQDAERFVDVMAATMSSSNTNVEMLGESFKYVAPVAGAMGYSVQDVSIALGLMANSGIKASQSGTALRTLMTNMSKPTKDMQIAMDKLGISLDDGSGNMKSFKEIMNDLRKGFGSLMIPQEEYDRRLLELNNNLKSGVITQKEYDEGLEDLTRAAYGAEGAEKARLAAMLAGKEGMSGLMAIVNASEEDYNDLTDAIYNSKGATQEMVDVMMNTLSGAFDIFKSTLESAGIQMGEVLVPIIRDVAEGLTDLVEWFMNLDDKTREFIVKAGLLVVALGPVLGLLGNLMTVGTGIFKVFGGGWSIIKTGVDLFGKLGGGAKAAGDAVATAGGTAVKAGGFFSKLWAIVSAHPFMAIIGVLVLLYAKCEWFRDGVNAIFGGIADFLGSVFGKIGDGLTWIGEKLGIVKKDSEDFKDHQKRTYGGWADNVVECGKKAGASLEEESEKAQEKTQKNTEDFTKKQGKAMKGWADNIVSVGKKAGAEFEKETKKSQDNASKSTERFRTAQNKTLGSWQKSVMDIAKKAGADLESNTKQSQNRTQSHTESFKNSQIRTHGAWKSDLTKKTREAADSMETNMKKATDKVNKDVETMKVTNEKTMGSFAFNMVAKGREVGAGLGDGIASGKIKVNNELNKMQNSAYSNLNNFNKGMNRCGQNAMTSFVNGLSAGMSSVKKLVGNIASMGQNIANSAWNAVNGRHATGLSYVPFDGYIAELHKGERVLTAKESEFYNRGQVPSGGGDTFNFYNTKPDPYEYYRQMKKAKRELLFEV